MDGSRSIMSSSCRLSFLHPERSVIVLPLPFQRNSNKYVVVTLRALFLTPLSNTGFCLMFSFVCNPVTFTVLYGLDEIAQNKTRAIRLKVPKIYIYIYIYIIALQKVMEVSRQPRVQLGISISSLRYDLSYTRMQLIWTSCCHYGSRS